MGIGKALRALAALAALPAALAVCAPAQAAPPAAHWLMISQPAPAFFHEGDKTDFYWIVAMNDGGAPSSGPITFKDTLPAGLTVNAIRASAEAESSQSRTKGEAMVCSVSGSPQEVECTSETPVPIGGRVIARITVEVPNGATGPLGNSASIEGGGAGEAAATSNSTPVVSSSTPVPYGGALTAEATSEDGHLDTQAGSHPFAFATQFAANVGQVNAEEEAIGGEACVPPGTQNEPGCTELPAASKDIEVQLPPGFVGDPLAVTRCSQEQFLSSGNDGCPASTQVGDVYIAFFGSSTAEQFAPVYDVEPPPGQPAELGFTIGGEAKIPMLFHVRSDGDYGLTVDFHEITNFDTPRLVSMMIWGVPAAGAHDPMRESEVNGCNAGVKENHGCVSEALPARPFLSLPSQCTGLPLSLPLETDSWEEPTPQGERTKGSPEASMAALAGCEALSFAPEVGVGTTTRQAGTPAGYQINLTVPQHESPEELVTPDVRDVEVTLPEGTVISPSAANGLVACTDAQFGKSTGKAGECPAAAKVGTVTIHSPLLMEPLAGSVYVGQPECSPCTPAQAAEGKMVRLFIEAKLPEPPPAAEHPPVLVKLAGRTRVDQATGRLTTTFDDNPQLPFSKLELALEHGPQAPLANPDTCGPVIASARLTAWSALFNGEGEVTDSGSQANVSSPPLPIEGCSPRGFSPSLAAGMTGTGHAGSYSPFSVTISRPDGQQTLGSITLHTPPGLEGKITGVPLCKEAQANTGECPAASQIGTSTALVGPGSAPYTIEGGKVYLTEKYGGGSFGLSIVTPATAGPFTLSGNAGNGTEVVRAAIDINPKTAALTIATGTLPTQLDGIPIDIQKVIVNVNREGFMFNPTNCNAMNVEGTITSSTGTASTSTFPFQATDCAKLPFHPGFAVKTRAHHTRRNGTSLHVSVTSGNGQANIKRVFVELPKILPSRIETLKLACSEAQFAANPAGCPAGSNVGTAVAHTPVLPEALKGPAIFVSHGGAKFPDLDVVLQGDGVTVILTGQTNIAEKSGITSSNFNTVPDVPVSTFELTLPAGPHSALTATGNLCTRIVTKRVKTRVHGKVVFRKRRAKVKRTLLMPTTITGQNGAVIKQNTKIAVTGCAKR